MARDHHHHAPPDYNRAFGIGIFLNIVFVLVEVGYGLWANSLALVADGGHNLSDVMTLVLAWVATRLAARQPTIRHTYGLKRATILAALASALLLSLAIGAIIWEAVSRFWTPAPVKTGPVMAVAALGVAVNTATALLFLSGRKKDLNIKAAFLHMAADAAVSAGVVLTGFLIMLTGRSWLDPAVSLFIALVILISGWGILRESFHLTLDGVPALIDSEAVLRYLAGLPGVCCVHDLHIWAMSTTENVLTAHLVIPNPTTGDDFLKEVAGHLEHRFHIHHTTIQVERENTCQACGLSRTGPE